VVTGFAFPSIGGGAAAYLTLRNDGTVADTVVEFSSPVAGSVMAHETVPEGAFARMPMLPEIPMAPNETVAMAPGGIHLMLGAVRDSLIPGRILPLTVRFARAGSATVQVPIRRIGDIP
jgi:copper(I)-binding protein